MSRLLSRCLANARNYQLKRWVKEVAKIKETDFSQLGLDPRDNECLREYLMNNADLATTVID